MNGRLVYSGINNRIIDMAPMKKGLYVLEITSGEKVTKLKIVRE